METPHAVFHFLRPIKLLRTLLFPASQWPPSTKSISLFLQAKNYQIPTEQKQLSECWAHFREIPFSLAASSILGCLRGLLKTSNKSVSVISILFSHSKWIQQFSTNYPIISGSGRCLFVSFDNCIVLHFIDML